MRASHARLVDRRGARAHRPLAIGLVGPAVAAQVDDATLLKPPAEAWVTYGRDYAETHHSPLATDRPRPTSPGSPRRGRSRSARRARSRRRRSSGTARSTAPRPGASSTRWTRAPARSSGGGIRRWSRAASPRAAPRYCCGPVNRGVAIYKGRVYVGLLDGRLVALDAENGRVVWSVQTTPVGADYSITGAPRIVKGTVVIGNGGGEYGVRGYLTAYDAETGKQAWRWFVVPGDPAKGLEDRSMEMAAQDLEGRVVEVRRRRHAVGRHRLRPRGQPRLRRHRQRIAVGPRPSQRRAPATTSTCRRSSRSTPTPAATSGTTRPRPATTGTTTPRSR